MPDSHTNFAYSTIATPPSPASTGTSVVLQSGDGVKFPVAPFNCVVCPVDTAPLVSNAEIVRVTNKASDTLTIVRTQEGSNARSIVVGDQIYEAITAKVLTDIESLTPVGTIHPYGGSSAPANFLMCDGTSYLRSAYPTLFSVLSTAYGAADGSHFNVPQLQDRFPLGAGAHARGTAGGALGHTHTIPGLTIPGLSVPSLTVIGVDHFHSLDANGYAAITFTTNTFAGNPSLQIAIRDIYAGGQMVTASFNYIAAAATNTVGGYNASAGWWNLSGIQNYPPALAGRSGASDRSLNSSTGTGTTGGGTTGGGTSGPADPPYQAVNYIIRAT